MCHIFENYMTQGYHKQWWRMNQWRITEGDAPQVVMHCIAWPILLMRRSFWCANPADALFLLMRRSCWCADPADVPILLMRQSCWCADPAYAPILLILLMHRPCWCTDPAQMHQKLMVHLITLKLCCCWWMVRRTFACHQLCCRDALTRGSGQDVAMSHFSGRKLANIFPNIFSQLASPQTAVTAGVGGEQQSCWDLDKNTVFLKKPQFP